MTTNINEASEITKAVKNLVGDRKAIRWGDQEDLRRQIVQAATAGVSPARARMRLQQAASACWALAAGERDRDRRRLYEQAAAICTSAHAEIAGSAGLVGWLRGHQREDLRDTAVACLAEEAIKGGNAALVAATERAAIAAERTAAACERTAAANEEVLKEAREGRAAQGTILNALSDTSAKLAALEAQLAALGGGAFRP